MMEEASSAEGSDTQNKTNQPTSSGNDGQQPGCMDKVKASANSCLASTGFYCFKFKEQTFISKLNFEIKKRQQKFGVDYLTLVQDQAPQSTLKQCLREAMNDVASLQEQINARMDNIDGKEEEKNVAVATGSRSAAKPAPNSPRDREEDHQMLEDDDEEEDAGRVLDIGMSENPIVQKLPEQKEEEAAEEEEEEDTPKPIKKKKKKKKKKPEVIQEEEE